MIIKVLALTIFLLFIFSPPAFAQYGVAAISSQQAMIEKKILNPQNNQFVDNLNIEQQTFLPNQDVIFRLTVTNTVQSDLKNLSVTDKLPNVLNFVSASFGSFDTNSKIVTLTVDSLKLGETKTFEIRTKVKSANLLPAGASCQTNLAKVTVSNMVGEDTSTFCVSQQVLGTTSQMPSTGPIQTIPMLVLSSLLLAISFLIKRIIYLERR